MSVSLQNEWTIYSLGPFEPHLGTKPVSQDEFHALLHSDVCPQTVIGLSTREQFLVDNLPEPAFLSSKVIPYSLISGALVALGEARLTTPLCKVVDQRGPRQGPGMETPDSGRRPHRETVQLANHICQRD